MCCSACWLYPPDLYIGLLALLLHQEAATLSPRSLARGYAVLSKAQIWTWAMQELKLQELAASARSPESSPKWFEHRPVKV